MHLRAGLVINQTTLPTAEDLANLGLLNGWIRCLVKDIDQFDRELGASPWPSSVKLCVLLEGQTIGIGGDFSGWQATIADFAQRFSGRVHAVECANELDIWHWQPPEGHEPNPLLTPEFAAQLVLDAAPHLRDANMRVIAPSVASGRWQEYLEAMTGAMGDAADFQAFHPYGQKIDGHPAHEDWGELAEAVARARGLAGRPLVLTELGVKVGEAGGQSGQAEYVRRLFGLMARLPQDVVEFFCYFAWKDRIGIPGEGAFGLVEENGHWRDACREFQRRCGGPQTLPGTEPTEPRFQFGFERWARLEPDLLGDPLEDELSPISGVAVQHTSRGLLFFANVDGGIYLFEELASNARHMWRDAWITSQPIIH